MTGFWPKTWTLFADVPAHAQPVLSDEQADQAAVNLAREHPDLACSLLTRIPAPLNTGLLRQAVDRVNVLDAGQYHRKGVMHW